MDISMTNRIVSTAHAEVYADDGMPGERYIRYYEEKAKGGVGLAICGGALMMLSFVFGQWPGLETLRSKRGYGAVQWCVGLLGFAAMLRSIFVFGMGLTP